MPANMNCLRLNFIFVIVNAETCFIIFLKLRSTRVTEYDKGSYFNIYFRNFK